MYVYQKIIKIENSLLLIFGHNTLCMWLHCTLSFCILVSDLYWISTYEFAAVYSPPGPPNPNDLPPQSSFAIVIASVSSIPLKYNLFIYYLSLLQLHNSI